MTFPELHHPEAAGDDDPVVLLHGGNVANWMWEPQLAALRHRVVVTPHLPGFGDRTSEPWPGLGGAADDIVDRVRELTGRDRFHVVGLSLGGVVALHLAARHPDAATSVLVSGVPLLPVTGLPRLAVRLHLRLWDKPWFWKAQAAAFRLPADSRGPYVEHGLSVRKETARRMLDDVHTGRVPEGLSAYAGPMLLVAGDREPATVRRSLAAAATVVPRATTRFAPGMHHVWNVEDPDLFDAMIRAWLEGRVEPRLRE
ncbi:alpha/beta hydrolase [Kribbella sp. ALI-6-A]|uniref:alpha/beta fold hydrolase n=1 Tax=Kribbella sp. ALI-6-A TaxID=1933817 RepID=UPI00097C0BD0|nr:alpha/beta fold hydrolase [Kribbella sp. ALI-6-A]ONI66832.1 alpha/beta hydrolase [Kribbella sp. ALI-6-A]